MVGNLLDARREQFEGLLRSELHRICAAGYGGVDFAVGNIGTVTSAEKINSLACGGIYTEILEGSLLAGHPSATARLGLADQFHGLFEGDIDWREVGG